jgi:DNA replication licensing factor MCM4
LSDPINFSSPILYGGSSQTPVIGGRGLLSPTGSNISSTGFKKRVDISTDSRVVRQINVGSEAPNAPSADGNQVVIWGTDVCVSLCKSKFIDFLRSTKFTSEELEVDELQKPMGVDMQSAEAYYIQKLEEIYTLEAPFLNVNCHHVCDFDGNLYRQMVAYPQEVIPAFDMAANELFHQLYPEASLPHQINVRPYNVVKTTSLRSLNPEDINHLVTISGMVIRCSNIIPEMTEAFFECAVCCATATVEVDRGRIVEPSLCGQCNTNYSFRLVHNRSQFIDKQQIKLQESPDDMPAGQTPYTVLLYACGDLVDTVQPGDRVTVTGIYRATPVRVNPKQRSVKAVYRTHVDVVHFRKVDSKRLHDENKEFKFTPERIDELKALSRQPDIYARLAHSLAPSIYSHEDMKKGVLLQLFGGTRKDITNNQNAKWRHFRSEINILLCGDPGTSKSQLLKFVHNMVPRGQYTSGKGSSAVGLTAYITKDADTKQLVLQTGALVLSDGGICCIDEFDKMSDSTRSVLHEVMEQQTLSIAKAGIVCQLNARTSVLAAANPVESQWNKNKTIIENIQLEHTLLSRFDLIYLMLDPQDEDYDRRLARHLVSLYYKTEDEVDEKVLGIDVLKDYIAYARNFVHSKLTAEAGHALIQAYVEMRKVGSGRGQITAYPRQLESLIRLAEAHAKVRLSCTVQQIDVEEAIRLHREAMKQAAIDPASGKIDVSILTTGMSGTSRKRREELASEVKKILQKNRSNSSQDQPQFTCHNIFTELKENSAVMITREMFEDALKDLQDEGFLVMYGGKLIRLNV